MSKAELMRDTPSNTKESDSSVNGEKRISFGENGEFGINEIRVGIDNSPGLESMTEDWNNIAPDYVEEYRTRRNTRYELIEIPELKLRLGEKLHNGKILDVGSGPLIFAEREVFNSHPENEWPDEYWALDPSENMEEIAEDRTGEKLWKERIVNIRSGIEEANLPEDYFDLAVGIFSLENSSDPREGLKRINESLKERGIFAGILKHQDRNQRYLKSYGDIDFKMFLKSLGADSLWAQEYWEGCGDTGMVWALYALNDTWRKWFETAGFSSVTLITPKITEKVKEMLPELSKNWEKQGHSGMIFIAKK